MKKIMLFLMFCLIATSGTIITNAEEEDSNFIKIAVDEGIDNIDITTLNQYSKATDYIWTCMYDRLLAYDELGNLSYSLAENISLILEDLVYSPIDLNDYNVSDVDEMDDFGWEDFQEMFVVDVLNNPIDFPEYVGNFSMVITLRTDIFYHDGTNMNAHDLYDYILFVKNNGINSRAYRQWLPIACMTVDDNDDYKIIFELDFSNSNYHFIEFLFSLSSPASSIGKIDDGENYYVGTGAYSFMDTDESSYVRLAKNNSWWDDNSTSVENLIFMYDSHLEPQNRNINYDIEIVSSESLIPAGNDEFIESDLEYRVANNPIILKNNHDESADNFMRDFVSSSAFYDSLTGCYFDNNGYINSLLIDSYDYWSYTNKFTGNFQVNLNQNINIICKNTETALYISSIMKLLFESKYVNSQLIINLPIYNFYQEKNESIYDFYVDEVDVEAINSVLDHLDYINNHEELSIVPLITRCGTVNAYKFIMANIQKKLCQNDSIAFMGWTYKNIYVNNQELIISGRICPNGFCPYGDAARIDLRFIA